MSQDPGEHAGPGPGVGPFTRIALGWIVGSLLGAIGGAVWLWAGVAVVPLLVMIACICRRRDRAARCWGMIALVAIAAGWYGRAFATSAMTTSVTTPAIGPNWRS